MGERERGRNEREEAKRRKEMKGAIHYEEEGGRREATNKKGTKETRREGG